jgi:asparagine synthase (glutamine-hydrolysing)
VVSRVQYVDAMTYLPEDILVKVDRMSMAHSLEVRSPILDHRVMEFAARLPSRFKLNGHGGKAIFKKMNADRLPEEIRNRRKQGFCVPLGSWFREDLKGYARDVLLGPGSGLGEIFRPEAVRRIWEAHQGGREDNAVPLWGLLMLELWRRRFSAGERSGGGARRAMEEESACIRRL